MMFRPLDSVVLTRDMPEFGLQAGDLGAIVEVYDAEGIEVEFVRGSGETQALVTLSPSDLRPIDGDELLAVRRARAELI